MALEAAAKTEKLKRNDGAGEGYVGRVPGALCGAPGYRRLTERFSEARKVLQSGGDQTLSTGVLSLRCRGKQFE